MKRQPKPTFESYLLNQKEYELLNYCHDNLEQILDAISPIFGRQIFLETELTDHEDGEEKLTITTCLEAVQNSIYERLRELIHENKRIIEHLKSKK